MAGAGIVRGAMAGPVGQQASSCVVAVRPSGQLGRFFLSRVSRVCLRRSARINVVSSPFQSGTGLGLTIWPPALELGSVEKRAVDGVRMMGGGPRTFPGGVTKWQWKRMQEKKAKQEEKARLAREKQLYNERRREEMMTASPFLEKPWQRAIPGSISPFPPMSADSRVRALADRFQKNRSEDLWTEEDGAVASSPKDPRPTARFLARASIHSNAFVERSEQQPSLKYAKSSGAGAVKRRVPPYADFMESNGASGAEGSLLLQHRKQKESPETSEKEDAVVTEKPAALSHLSQTRFDKFNISPLSLKAIHEVMGFKTMTVVQDATLPVILKGQDVLAKAKTGTGKTIAFLLPAMETILKTQGSQSFVGRSPINVVVICPTRELASQAAKEATMLMTFQKGLGVQLVIGGTNMNSETKRLDKQLCQLLVGTPGRLLDHIQSNPDVRRQLQHVKVLVLDEADQLLDMGFRKSLDGIIKVLPQQRQTLLFSATIPDQVFIMSQIALKKDHVFIDTVGEEDEETHAKVKQEYLIVPLEKQLSTLYALLTEHAFQDPNFKVLVFCTTARVTALMAELYKKLGLNTLEIHSRKSQVFRTRVSDEFRKSRGGVIMFTSDVSARGIDYPDVTLVVQVGTPAGREQYIHRLGRTGRAGKEGLGLLLLMPWEEVFLQSLKDISITPAPPIDVPVALADKVNKSLRAVSDDTKDKAYQAWLGYYNSCTVLKWEKSTLVKRANLFSASLGLDEPPTLLKRTIAMMGLKNVPGLLSA
ncbi:unnamed protein product [Sphagnum jensenii]|uniref:ATP-dependent RNA helicase n=1 Tax=Sphagnum jensenii TaxID=128206 RepID=A0ABP1AQS2_9BRYO